MSRAALLPLLLLSPLAGCVPWTIWHGMTPDRQQRVELIEREGRQELNVDGNVFASFEAIGFEGLVFSEDGLHLALPARIEGRWRVVHDGEIGPPFGGVGEVVMDPSGEHLAYAALDGAVWRVIHDGQRGPPLSSIRAGSLLLGAGGRRLAYVARRAGSEHAVIDGEIGPPFDRIEQLGFGFEGRRVAYVGRRGGLSRVVIDRRAEAPALGIGELVLAESAPTYAYLVDKGEGMVLARDGSLSGDSHEELGGLRLSADGAHLAVLARDGDRERVLWDGRWLPFDHLQVDDRSLTLGEDGRHLGYLAWDRDPQGRRLARAILDGRPGPFYAELDPPIHRAGRWGYIGRDGLGSVVHLGQSRFVHRGAWAGALTLPAARPRGLRGFAYLLRRGRRTRVISDRGRSEPFEALFRDTLTFDEGGRAWAILGADREHRRLFVLLEGGERRPFDLDELSARLLQGGELRSREGVTREIRRWLRAEIRNSMSVARPEGPE